MADFELRPYRGDDESALIATWNVALPVDPVDVMLFRRKVLLDANFDPERLLTATRGEEVLGFCLCVRRRVALPEAGLEPERSWLTAFGVRPDCQRHGIGSALLNRSLGALAAAGCTQVSIASYTPNYLVPGVDQEAYAAGLKFLLARGFQKVTEAISMDANIVKLDWGPYSERKAALARRGVRIRHLEPADIPALLRLMWDAMPSDWIRHMLALLDDAARGLAKWTQVSVAIRGQEIRVLPV
jgi:mycothiol synthase